MLARARVSINSARSEVVEMALISTQEHVQFSCWAAVGLYDRKGKLKAKGERVLVVTESLVHVWLPERRG